MTELACGALLRMVQAFVQGAPFIFTGLCITGMLSRLMGHADTKRLFGSNSIASLAQSWFIGMLLPGCSLGVIPICRRLRASGIAIGTIFAFALSSPLFDPLSLLYGLTLSKPFTILAFACCSFVVVTVSGAIFDWLYPDTEVVVAEPPAPPHGIKRILAIAVEMARETVGPTAGLIGIGILGVGLLAVILPTGSLQQSMAHDNPWSPLLMTGVAIPAYATPMTAMGQLGSMFQHGNSIGAAFILLTFGAGMNLGLMAWMWRNYGFRKLAVWFGLMLLVVVGLSYGIERPLYPRDVEPAGHTHAFDRYCAPFIAGSPPSGGYLSEIVRKVRLETQPHEWFGVAALATLAAIGGLLRLVDPARRLDAWLVRHPPADESRRPSRLDMDVPGPVLAVVGLLGIVAMSVAGCYAYYPEPTEVLEELSIASTEVASAAISGNREHALHWIPVCEGWSRRLVVGTYLRRWRVSDYHLMKARLFEDRLEELEHAVEDGDSPEEVREHALAASRAFRFLSMAYRSEPLD
ncbi:MAG: permease [Planctomycetia bacterium]